VSPIDVTAMAAAADAAAIRLPNRDACGKGCSGSIPVQAFLQGLPPGRWTRLAVPLKCFARAGADLGRVSDLLELRTASRLELSVSRIALGDDYDHLLGCPGG